MKRCWAVVGLFVALAGCSSTSDGDAPEPTCDLPAAIDPSTLSLPPSLFVPKLRHDLILEYPSAEALSQMGRAMTSRVVVDRDQRVISVLRNVQSIDAGTYAIFEYKSSDELEERGCALLAELQRLSNPTRVIVINEPAD